MVGIVTGDFLNTPLRSINGKVTRRSTECAAFLIWSIMMVKRQEIYNLLLDVGRLGCILNKEIPKMCTIIGTIIIIVIPFMAWMSMTLPFLNEDECRAVMMHHCFGYDFVRDGDHCSVQFILLFFRQFLIYTLRTAVTVTYVTICCFLRNILNTHSEFGAKRVVNPKSRINCVYLKYFLEIHEQTIRVLKRFEKIMSLPIFLIVSSDFTAMMYGVIRTDPLSQLTDYYERIQVYIPAITFVALQGMVSFLCISLAASNVHEASKKANEVLQDMLKRVLVSGQKRDIHELVPISILYSNPPFILSAWGVFHFTRGIFLAALGSILTYSLLITQILK
ncbi:uncharacterized protein TNIN_368771 [Trichonephila inaurata madagascariensis]|uniref:Gustatory receptor n=1 Tax=Trichonephila inaurata madagascariensis TaxID=2747483 RepID=A0A8X6XQ35_9ARAC|nr:uncharacterized protein TNIN_368771 [Trichonephila inaurata madagascariensis]